MNINYEKLGFKKIYLSDKSGFWYEKAYIIARVQKNEMSLRLLAEPDRGLFWVEFSIKKRNGTYNTVDTYFKLTKENLFKYLKKYKKWEH